MKSWTCIICRQITVVILLALGLWQNPAAVAQDSERVAIDTALPNGREFSTAYRLGTGDQLRVIVFGEEDLTGEFTVNDLGYISFPLIGRIYSRDLSLRNFEQKLVSELRQGYLLDPRVSVEISNFRPFYIYGEVENGGEYPYVVGMSVMNAVAIAGGYSYRANTKRVMITRAGTSQQIQEPATHSTLLFPGDIIEVKERFF